jgi:hypothetical protein
MIVSFILDTLGLNAFEVGQNLYTSKREQNYGIFVLGFIFHTGWPINIVPILLTTILMEHTVRGRGTYENNLRKN